MIELEALLDLWAEVHTRPVGSGPYGNRWIFEVSCGEFQGPRLRGKVLQSGGDWMLVGSDQVARLDVRLTLETHDSALVYMQFLGVLDVNDKLLAAVQGSHEAQYGDTLFMTQPRFETGDSRYTWLNRYVGLSEGKLSPNRVDYRVYQAKPVP
ncbi:MAG: DUF3237 domain-containing protein [Myxococcota bacterium]|nr:DUF3237 domain-containing protein [Myxococcota bacterium]